MLAGSEIVSMTEKIVENVPLGVIVQNLENVILNALYHSAIEIQNVKKSCLRMQPTLSKFLEKTEHIIEVLHNVSKKVQPAI